MGLVRHSGSVGGSAGGLDDLNTDTTETVVANTTTETTVYTYTVPGGTLSTNKLLVLLLPFSILSNGGVNPTLTIKVKYGSTTVITYTSVGLQVFGTVLGGDLRIYLYGDGATNAQEAVLQGTSDSNASHKYSGTGTAAEDSTGDLALAVTIQWSHANANISFIMKSAVLLGPYAP